MRPLHMPPAAPVAASKALHFSNAREPHPVGLLLPGAVR
jgi:hypothetical protein